MSLKLFRMNLIFVSSNHLSEILAIYNFYFHFCKKVETDLLNDFSDAIFMIFPKIKLQTQQKLYPTITQKKGY